MNIIQLFIQNCPKSPLIYPGDLVNIQNQCRQLLKDYSRAKKIPLLMRQPQECFSDAEVLYLEKLSELHFDVPYLSIAELFIKDELNSCFELKLIQSDLWNSLISEWILSDDKVFSMQLLQHLKILFFNPAQFAGLLKALIKHDYHPIDILHSGLMQHFFSYYVYQIDIISETYALLEHDPVMSGLIEQAKQTSCGMVHFLDTNILGVRSTTPLFNIQLDDINSPIHLSDSTFYKLFELLGLDFLLTLLSESAADEQEKMIHLLDRWLTSQSFETIKNLLKNIIKQLPHELCQSVLKLICPSIPDEIALQLIDFNPDLFWIILSCCPSITGHFPKKPLHQLCKSHDMHTLDIPFVFALANKRPFRPIQDYLLEKIFHLYLLEPELILDDHIIHALKHCKNIKLIATHEARLLHNDLFTCIQQQLEHFDHEKFITIRDCYFAQRSILKKLESIEIQIADYPQDHYDLTSVILDQLFKMSEPQKMLCFAGEMLPLRVIEEHLHDEYIHHLQRIIYEWVEHTRLPNALIFAIYLLNDVFHVSLQDIERQLLDKRLSIQKIALTNPFCLHYFLKLYPSQDLYKILTQVKHPDYEPLIESIIHLPKFMQLILDILPQQTIFELMCFQYRNKEPIFFQLVKYAKSLELVVSQLQPKQFQALLLIENRIGNNVFHMISQSPNSLNILLKYTHPKMVLSLINHSNFLNETSFSKTIEHLTSFEALISHLDKENLIELASKSSFHNCKSYLHSILECPQVGKIFLERLTISEHFELLTGHLDMLVKHFIHRPEILDNLFKHLQPTHCFALANLNYKNQPLVHHLALNPKAFACLFEHIDIQQRLALLLTTNPKLQTVIQCFTKPLTPYIETLILNLDKLDLFEVTKLHLNPQRQLIDVICQDIELFQKLFSKLAQEQQMALLQMYNSNHLRVIDLLPLHDDEALHVILEHIDPQLRNNLIIKKNEQHENLLQRSLAHPKTLDLFLSYTQRQEIIEHLFQSESPYCLHLYKLSDCESTNVLMKYLHPIDQPFILMHKHKKYAHLLQLSINHPPQFLSLLHVLNEEMLNIITQKIMSQSLNCRPLLENPNVLVDILREFPLSHQSNCLKAICQQNPDLSLSYELKSALSRLLFPRKKHASHHFFQANPAYKIDDHIKHSHHLSEIIANIGSELTPKSPLSRNAGK
jgi:hypothetical protein